jgi:hypothetical protein
MLEKWQCSQHRIRTVRLRIYAAHLTVYRGILEPLEQVEIDAFPTAFVTSPHHGYFLLDSYHGMAFKLIRRIVL